MQGARHNKKGKKKENQRYLSTIFDLAACFAASPCLLAGDFNAEPTESDAVVAALRSGRWEDLAALEARGHTTAEDQELGNIKQAAATCRPRQHTWSRIDYMLANELDFRCQTLEE